MVCYNSEWGRFFSCQIRNDTVPLNLNGRSHCAAPRHERAGVQGQAHRVPLRREGVAQLQGLRQENDLYR